MCVFFNQSTTKIIIEVILVIEAIDSSLHGVRVSITEADSCHRARCQLVNLMLAATDSIELTCCSIEPYSN